MRSFIAGDSSDSTSAALAHLAANRVLRFADLYVINTAPNYAGEALAKTFLLTSHGAPLNWGHRGTFTPTNIERTGVQSKFGLEVDTMDITWSPPDLDILLSGGSPVTTLLTVIQGINAGCFTRGNVEVWRCLMPTDGDCNTLGACLLFAGRIGNISQDRLKPKLTVVSRLEALNKMVPSNTIEPGNIGAQYSVGIVPPNAPSAFTILSGSTASKILAAPVSTPSGYSMMDDLYSTGYLIMASGTLLGGHYAHIRRQSIEGSPAYHVFYLDVPMPFTPTVGDTFSPFVPAPIGYSLLPFNQPFPATQAGWVISLNGGTLNLHSDGGHNYTYTFQYHDGTTDVYRKNSGGGGQWVTIDSGGTLNFPSSQPAQDEPGIGAIDTHLGFPYCPIPINAPMTF